MLKMINVEAKMHLCIIVHVITFFFCLFSTLISPNCWHVVDKHCSLNRATRETASVKSQEFGGQMFSIFRMMMRCSSVLLNINYLHFIVLKLWHKICQNFLPISSSGYITLKSTTLNDYLKVRVVWVLLVATCSNCSPNTFF